MFEKVITNYGIKGVIDAETFEKYRLVLKTGGYKWIFKESVRVITDDEYNSDDVVVTKKDKPNSKFRHHNVEEGY